MGLYLSASLVVIYLVIRLVRRDLDSLVEHSRVIAEGLYDHPLEFDGFDDFAHLADNVRRMAAAIREREGLLRERERRLSRLIDSLPVPTMAVDGSGGTVLMNRVVTATFGWTREDVPSMAAWWDRTVPEPDARADAAARWDGYVATMRMDDASDEAFETRMVRKDGSQAIVAAEAAVIGDLVVVTLLDITESRLAAERAAASLREKETLLKEIHHRVKNNLQLVVSLLSLEAGASPGSGPAFSVSIDRIRVMATIHELLYESTDLSHIDLGEFVRTISEWLVSSYQVGAVQPSLAFDLEPIELDIDKAVPCGLIINEIVTNALKYAFSIRVDDPRIRVELRRVEPGDIRIRIEDNGAGLPTGVDPATSDSLGMQLIVSLTAQLKGEWRLERDAGTRWTVTFGAGTAIAPRSA